jgi:hypothetical protein
MAGLRACGARRGDTGIGQAAAWNAPGQRRQPDPVHRPIERAREPATQHGVLMTQDEDLELIGEVSAREHDHQADQPTHQRVRKGENTTS